VKQGTPSLVEPLFSNGDASASNSSHNSRNLLMGNETFFIGENKIVLLL